MQPEQTEPQQSKAQTGKPAQKLRTLRHRLLGRLFLLRLPPLDIGVHNELPMMSDPPTADTLLLRREGEAWTEKQRAVLPDGIRDSKARYHLLECKLTESANQWAVQQALGYDSLYLRNQELKPDELQTYLLSAKTPDKKFLAELHYQSTGVKGVYVTTLPIVKRVMLLVLNELSNEPHNELLRLFASRQAVRQQTMATVMTRHASEWPDEVWAVVFGLQRLYQLEEQSMKQELTVDTLIEIGDKMRKQIIATISPKDLDEQVRKQVIASAPVSERLAGLAPKDRLAGLASDEMVTLIEEIEAMLGKQKTERKVGRMRSQKKKTQ